MFYVIGKEDFGLKILNSLRCGILSVNLHKEITAINEIAQRIFELANINQVGRRVEEVFAHQPQLWRGARWRKSAPKSRRDVPAFRPMVRC
jgi:sensor histidine kinase regulating citrate/malate metabolism